MPYGAILMLGVLFVIPIFTQAQGYVEPEGPPPFNAPDRTGGADAPIEFLNGTAGEQRKIGSLILGERYAATTAATVDDTRIAYYTCDQNDTFLKYLLQEDPYLFPRTTFFTPPSSECGTDPAPFYVSMMDQHDDRPFDVIIAQESELHASMEGRLQDFVNDGGMLFISGETPSMSAPTTDVFAGVEFCQSYQRDAINTGCNFIVQNDAIGSCPTGNGSCPYSSPPEPATTGGIAKNVDHGLWNFATGAVFDKPPEQRFEGIFAQSTNPLATSIPIIDVPYTMSRNTTNWEVGLAAHWQFGLGTVYYLADEAEDGITGTTGLCDRKYCSGGTNAGAMCTVAGDCPGGSCSTVDENTMCINGDFPLTKLMFRTIFRRLTDGCSGSSCSALCLNPNPANGLNDASCIRDWSGANAFIGGPFLRLLGPSELAEVDDGFAALQGNGHFLEYMSVIGEANSGVNNSVGIRGQSTTTSSYAGLFSGKVVAQRNGPNTEICLNGTCLSAWSAIAGAPTDSVTLQNSRNLTKQDDNIGLTGSIVGDSIVLGVPHASSLPAYTCGDGICSTQNGENSTTCPAPTPECL